MGISIGQRLGEIVVTALWPLIWVFYVLISLVIIAEAAAVYVSWSVVSRLDRLVKKTGPQAAS